VKSVKEIETSLFLDDFEAEARAHIEQIETAFLDADALVDDPNLINGVFRNAHSLKGTAGFFSLTKIVSVAHELESVFSLIKEGELIVDDDLVDIVLQSVDCLKDLIDNMRDDDSIQADPLVHTLKRYSAAEKETVTDSFNIPFNVSHTGITDALQSASRFGHNFFYVIINFNRSLGIYYKQPGGIIDMILSVGAIAEAVISSHGGEDKDARHIIQSNANQMREEIVKALAEYDTAVMDLLVTSILDADLFAIAIEVDRKYIHQLQKETVFRRETAEAPVKRKEKPDGGQVYKKSAPSSDSSSIRLDVSVINGLMDLANEMILTRNQLLSAVSVYKDSTTGLAPVLHDMNRLTSEIQEKVMFTRMQPISVIFNKFPRIIRDTAKELGKEITVNISRDDVAFDKYLLEELVDPVTQLVKNSADHGIESAERRTASGKPQIGTITLAAHLQDGAAIVEVIDDGGGMDKDAIRRTALERGIATGEALSAMQDSEVFNLVFEPGFSTSPRITNLSGRGVGMDIVKTNVEKLGGSIEIESELGNGTTIRLKLPLTLSVIMTLIVTIDSIPYAIPESSVERIVRIGGDTASKRIERVNNSLILILDGRIIPIVTMDEIAAKAHGRGPINNNTLIDRIRQSGVVKCLLLKADGKSYALLIDNALDMEQILVKPLPVYLKQCPCYSNVTVLGNGSAVTVLDALGIMRLMGVEDIMKEAAGELTVAAESVASGGESETAEKQVIVFKCSGPEHFTVETKDVSRIVAIRPEDIQEIGNGQFINISGETVRVVRPERFTPVKNRNYTGEKLYMLKLKNSVYPTGLLAGKLLDKLEGTFFLDSEHIHSDYIFGTCVHDEKVLIFLNPAAIVETIRNDKVGKSIQRKRGMA